MPTPTQGISLDPGWRTLCRVGGAAGLAAGLIARRNIGAEIALFSAQRQPDTIVDWFILLQRNRLLGLAYLNLFDLANYALVGLMLLALFAVLGQSNKSAMSIALVSGLVGITVFFATNTALSLLALSDQYAATTSEAQGMLLLPAGQALLALNRFSSPGAHPGAGGYASLLLIAAAGMITSAVMLRSNHFSRLTGYVGVVANGLDLAYCAAFALLSAVDGELLAISFIPAAGLFLMIWHILVGWQLYRIGAAPRIPASMASLPAP